MSSGRDQVARSQIEALRAELSSLRICVEELTSRVERLEESAEAEKYEFVSEARSSVVEPAVSLDRRSTCTPTLRGSVASTDAAGRRQLAEEIGKFLARARSGDFRGSSGRDRLDLANRCYLIVSDYSGHPLETPIYTTQFSEVKRLCKRGADAGRSVFVGLPSKWEAAEAIRCSGLPVPASLRDE